MREPLFERVFVNATGLLRFDDEDEAPERDTLGAEAVALGVTDDERLERLPEPKVMPVERPGERVTVERLSLDRDEPLEERVTVERDVDTRGAEDLCSGDRVTVSRDEEDDDEALGVRLGVVRVTLGGDEDTELDGARLGVGRELTDERDWGRRETLGRLLELVVLRVTVGADTLRRGADDDWAGIR